MVAATCYVDRYTEFMIFPHTKLLSLYIVYILSFLYQYIIIANTDFVYIH
jgi:hypothetical protein